MNKTYRLNDTQLWSHLFYFNLIAVILLFSGIICHAVASPNKSVITNMIIYMIQSITVIKCKQKLKEAMTNKLIENVISL